jgi:hypothetical protein
MVTNCSLSAPAPRPRWSPDRSHICNSAGSGCHTGRHRAGLGPASAVLGSQTGVVRSDKSRRQIQKVLGQAVPVRPTSYSNRRTGGGGIIELPIPKRLRRQPRRTFPRAPRRESNPRRRDRIGHPAPATGDVRLPRTTCHLDAGPMLPTSIGWSFFKPNTLFDLISRF